MFPGVSRYLYLLNILALQMLWLLYGLCHHVIGEECNGRTMRNTEYDFERLDEALRLTPSLSSEAFQQVIKHCTRLSSLRQAGKATKLDRLIEAGAWTDAAIALIEFELPYWSVRRIVCEDGEWLCSLSRQPNLPILLDEPAEGSHPVLALAILRAFVGARSRSVVTRKLIASVPQVRPTPAFVFCCDNLA